MFHETSVRRLLPEQLAKLAQHLGVDEDDLAAAGQVENQAQLLKVSQQDRACRISPLPPRGKVSQRDGACRIPAEYRSLQAQDLLLYCIEQL